MNLQDKYQKEIIPVLKEKLKRENVFSLPKLEKVVINVGLKEGLENSKIFDLVSGDLMAITGQKPVITRAKKAIANFKLRIGDKIGVKVTLRQKKMDDFLEKLINLVLPRVRDFRGISPACFDKSGNYTLGITEYSIFPEIDTSKVDKIRGLEISIITTAKNQAEGKLLLDLFGFPFTKDSLGR